MLSSGLKRRPKKRENNQPQTLRRGLALEQIDSTSDLVFPVSK
jgi:hypothetical protein